jgi:hypothetical protein
MDEFLRDVDRGLDPGGNSDYRYRHQTTATVESGRFGAALDLSGWPAGQLTVEAAFVMDPSQPEAAAEAYGARGERLSGPNLQTDSDGQRYLDTSEDLPLP